MEIGKNIFQELSLFKSDNFSFALIVSFPILSSFVALSEVSSGFLLIVSGFINKKIGNYLTRLSAFIIVVIMICAFYFAHSDWFINSKLFKSEQIFLLLIGIFFLVNGNEIKK